MRLTHDSVWRIAPTLKVHQTVRNMVALPRSKWDAQPPQLATTDKITVRNLQATVNAGVDVWGRVKSQRALISVTLSLAKPFDSAAKTDVVDNSTVHYGKLSKDIQACIQDFAANSDADNRKTTSDLMAAIHEQIKRKTVPDNKILRAIEVDIFYPKGSMLGDGAGYSLGHSLSSSDIYTQLYLRNVRVPCLIGVNSNERLQKQPVVINLWIEPVSVARSEDYPKLESAVVEVRQGFIMNGYTSELTRVQVVSDSSFETLESLTTTIVQRLGPMFTEKASEDVNEYIRLRIEKPHAVPAADAPSIEIFRPLR